MCSERTPLPPLPHPLTRAGSVTESQVALARGSVGEGVDDALHAVSTLLRFVGEDPNRDGLADTPARVAKAYQELTCGYHMNPATLFSAFAGEGYDEMVLETNIPFYSLCEHHMLPFHGKAHVGYVPGDGDKIIGLSKLPRLVEVFSRRLQVQERLTTQVVDALDKYAQPLGAICVIEAEHMCVAMRGVRCAGAITTTSKVSGIFRTQPETRAEAMSLIRRNN